MLLSRGVLIFKKIARKILKLALSLFDNSNNAEMLISFIAVDNVYTDLETGYRSLKLIFLRCSYNNIFFE